MSVMLSPVAPRYAVSDADDPFKKYWWAILMGIVFTALWLLTPMLGEKSIGSTAIDTSKPKVSDDVEQSLTADAGDGINLSMEGTGKPRKEADIFGSSLYQPPPEDPALKAGATAGSAALGSASASASGGTLAGELKKVSESNGWGEKPQRGFTSPRLSGGSLSGLGSAGGGKAGSASASAGLGAFGSKNAKIGFGSASGLSGSVEEDKVPEAQGLAVLKAAASESRLAALSTSNDDARSSLSKAFDGAKGGSKIGGDKVGEVPGNYGALDTAPVNLKLDDPKLNGKKIEAPPPAEVPASKGDDMMGQQMAMQLGGALLGAMIGGPVGGIVTQVVMQAVQRQMDQQQKVRDLEEKQQLDRAARRMGASPS